MTETVIVIRSLIPGGVAHLDQRIVPGDRLVYVNDIRLDNASLDMAVQALKGAPFGPVRLGIAKPLSEGQADYKAEVSAIPEVRVSLCHLNMQSFVCIEPPGKGRIGVQYIYAWCPYVRTSGKQRQAATLDRDW